MTAPRPATAGQPVSDRAMTQAPDDADDLPF